MTSPRTPLVVTASHRGDWQAGALRFGSTERAAYYCPGSHPAPFDTGVMHGPWSGVDSLREAPFYHAHYQHLSA